MRKFVKTMSLFTRLGSWSVRRRTNRVFPKPPRLDETTRTQSLDRIQSISLQISIPMGESYSIPHVILYWKGNDNHVIILSEVKIPVGRQFS